MRITGEYKKALCIPFCALATFALVAVASAQTISYLIPDVGTPGMNTYVEIIGTYNQNGNFGVDGIYLNNSGDAVRVMCANPSDTQLVCFGPCIVSWNGRMISTQAFVLPNVNATSADWQQGIKIPIQVEASGNVSSIDTFYIVKPQSLGVNGLLSSPGVFGSGMQAGINWGERSRRGAMIVDSLILSGTGTYTVSTQDCDLAANGNQGYLPFVLISHGNIEMENTASLSVSANDSSGGPGGAGGGNGLICGSMAGDGFTGGGLNNDLCKPQTGCTYQPPPSSGSGDNSASLNGVPAGGYSNYNEGGGGGTGHPFGRSGSPGNGGPDSTSPIPSGYGGGSGGPYCCWNAAGWGYQGGGGGGGFASKGNDGGTYDLAFPAGSIVGNAELMPIAGGSGGGGGNLNSDPMSTTGAGNGGGGGGIIVISSVQSSISGQIVSLGSAGASSSTNGAGGGGSGGAVIFSSKLPPAAVPSVNVSGGIGGSGFPVNVGQDGGGGGAGRVRVDGPSASSINFTPNAASSYQGPSTDTAQFVERTFTLNGTGNGDSIRLYIRPISGEWFLDTTLGGYSGNTWNSTITLPGTDTLYFLAVAQQVPNPSSDPFTIEPGWVLSQAAANILRVPQCEYTKVDLDLNSQAAGHDVNINLYLGSLPLLSNADSIQVMLIYNNNLLSFDSIIRGCVDSIRINQVDSMHTQVILYFPPGHISPDSTCDVADIRTKVMVTSAEATGVSVESLALSTSGISTLASTCSVNSSFVIASTCGDSTLRQFMETGTFLTMIPPYPNPVFSSTILRYTLAAQAPVSLAIYDQLGRLVAQPIAFEMQNGGEHAFSLDGSQLGPGIYQCRLSAGDYGTAARIVLLK